MSNLYFNNLTVEGEELLLASIVRGLEHYVRGASNRYSDKSLSFQFSRRRVIAGWCTENGVTDVQGLAEAQPSLIFEFEAEGCGECVRERYQDGVLISHADGEVEYYEFEDWEDSGAAAELGEWRWLGYDEIEVWRWDDQTTEVRV